MTKIYSFHAVSLFRGRFPEQPLDVDHQDYGRWESNKSNQPNKGVTARFVVQLESNWSQLLLRGNRQAAGRRNLCALCRLCVGNAYDYTLTKRPCRSSDCAERY